MYFLNIYFLYFLKYIYIYKKVIMGEENDQVPTDRKLKFWAIWLGKCLSKHSGSFPESFCLSWMKEHL